MAGSRTLSRCLLLAAVASMMWSGQVSAQAAPAADPDWPCVQRLLPEIAGGMVWAGPPLDQVEMPDSDREFDALARELAARRVPIEQAEQDIDAYVQALNGQATPERLAALFKATLAIINDDRSSIINGIKKFSKGQRTLAEKINAKNQEIEGMDRSDVLAHDAAVAERDWDVRIFDDRRHSLTYLCEQPVLLEQRAFTLARALASHLE
ncbi:MAG: hypothetical protein R3F54_11275 [Alphaproteobacteria bacterium]